MASPAPQRSIDESSVTERIIEYIEHNYAAQISLRDVAAIFGYSPCHLTHTFRLNTGLPITAWIIKRRITAARRLLEEANIDVASTCEAVGFNDLCYFTRQFVRHVGTTPGRFRTAVSHRGPKDRSIKSKLRGAIVHS
jgi:AraC-like DNA-binding protein